MTPKQRIELKQSDLRKKVGALLELETRSEDQDRELNEKTLELRGLESDLQAAILLEGDSVQEVVKETTPQGRELRGIIQESNITDYVNDFLGKSPLDGASLELRQETGVPDDYIPHEVFDGSGELETRADAVTNYVATDTASPDNVEQIYPRVFAMGCAAYLGTMMPSVGVGSVNYPRLNAGTTGDVRSPSQALDGTAATITTATIDPVRLTASYTFTVESTQLIRGIESALTRDLRQTLNDKLDKLVINGQAKSGSTSPKIDGLLNSLAAATAASAQAGWSDYLSAYDGAVDGIHASSDMDVCLLVNPATWQHAMIQLVGTGGEAGLLRDKIDRMRFKASANMPAVASKKAKAIRYAKTSPTRGMYAPVWRGVNMIRDHYTGAAKGEISITFLQIVGFKVVDTRAYTQLEFQVEK